MIEAKIPANFYFKYEIVVEAFNRLIELMQRDSELIKDGALNELQTKLDTRIDLVNFLTLQQQNLAQNPELKTQLTNQQRTTLLDLSTQLNQVAEFSQREVQKAMIINEKILTLFKNAVKSAKNKSVGYSSIGKMRASSVFAEIPHVALNQTL